MAPIKRSVTHSRNEKKIGLLDLSGEIRNHIYRILFVDSYPIDVAPPLWKQSKFKTRKTLPKVPDQYPVQLFRVNKQVHREAASIFYSENTFQLSILYPNLSTSCFPLHNEIGLDDCFSVLSLRYRPKELGSLPDTWQFQCYDPIVWRWNYIMPCGKQSRSNIERQAREGQKTTRMYWPSERYRRMIKRLRIQLFLEKGRWGTMHYITLNAIFNSVVVRSSLATFFEGILNRAHVELAIWAPHMAPDQQWSDDELRDIKRIMIAFTPLTKAKTLVVTANGELKNFITERRCTELRVAIRRYARSPKVERPRWKSSW